MIIKSLLANNFVIFTEMFLLMCTDCPLSNKPKKKKEKEKKTAAGTKDRGT